MNDLKLLLKFSLLYNISSFFGGENKQLIQKQCYLKYIEMKTYNSKMEILSSESRYTRMYGSERKKETNTEKMQTPIKFHDKHRSLFV